MELPLLSLLVWGPFVGALVCLGLPARYARYSVYVACIVLLVEVFLAAILFSELHMAKGIYAESNFLWVERHVWFVMSLGERWGHLRVDYLLGVDGLSGPLVLLAALLFLVALGPAWRMVRRPRLFFSLYLLLCGAVMGALCSLDMLLLFLFLEFLVLPTYVLIAFWGGRGRTEAALQFLLYTLSGSVLIFFVLLGLYLSISIPQRLPTEVGLQWVRHLDLTQIINTSHYKATGLFSSQNMQAFWGLPLRGWAFLALCVGLGIKVPLIPGHGWLPKAHVEASTSISIILAGVLLKLGAYGLFRIGWGVFPDQVLEYAPVLAFFAVFSIVYAGLNALVQMDLKRLIAYASIAHMGFVVLGMSSLSDRGMMGAVYQMLSHGLVVAALFLIVDGVEQRTGTRNISHLSGLADRGPRLAAFALLFFCAAFGLPGFSGFVAEMLVLMGAFEAIWAQSFSWGLGIFALLGIVLAAAYFIWAYQRVFQGPYWIRNAERTIPLRDICLWEVAVLSGLLGLVLVLGLYPQPVLEAMYTTIHHLKLLMYTYGSS